METWFILAVGSVFAAGIYTFTTKIAAERNYDVVLLSTASVFVAVVFYMASTFIWSNFEGQTLYLWGLATLAGATYMYGNTVRHCALQCIDTAIYFPIYKTITPLLAIIAGILFSLKVFQGLNGLVCF